VHGTTSVLKTAQMAGPQLKSVVVTSSTIAIGGPTVGADGKVVKSKLSEKDWNNGPEMILDKLGDSAPGGVFYATSKVRAEKAVWQFVNEQKVSQS
jgi:nucleoside-diphosphate-sugar epimerase